MGKRYLVTGGAGFIGSAMIKKLIKDSGNIIANVDKLTYASNLKSLLSLKDNDSYSFFNCDICDFNKLKEIIINFRPEIIINFAAESHVDRSIFASKEFINSNIYGTYNLLEICRELCEKKEIIFHHISTDEVYGDIEDKPPSVETDSYKPSSPYSSSKAASDHLVKAWHRTYKLPVFITNCSNNYGPYQHKEKLIPKVITNILNNKDIPVYGNGEQIRDWIFVEDHISGILKVLESGEIGETYNLGGSNEIRNIDLIHRIIELINKINNGNKVNLDKMRSLITYVEDRLGHDKRYAINSKKAELIGWSIKDSFEINLEKTIKWYMNEV
jgi:dTDP-glucose 4,6-dehydratase